MKKIKLVKIVLLSGLSILMVGIAVVLYMLNMPHRDVSSSKTDYEFTSSQIVDEYLTNWEKANNKFLANDGNSKILEISGTVSKISSDFKEQKVILLKEENQKVGVNCTFSLKSNEKVKNISVGDFVKIKGVIHSGATYDEDLELYEHVNLEQCIIIKL